MLSDKLVLSDKVKNITFTIKKSDGSVKVIKMKEK